MDDSHPCLKVTTHSQREHLPGWVIGFLGRAEFPQSPRQLPLDVGLLSKKQRSRCSGRFCPWNGYVLKV
ncbi:unnamed protein product, partial [Gulo gulo]